MYGIWSLKSKSKNETLFRESPAAPRACNACRTKKIKCSGQLSGCARCEDLGFKCTYSIQKEHNTRRRRLSSTCHPVLKKIAMAPRDSSEQYLQDFQIHSPSASLSDPSKEEAKLPKIISTNGVPFPGLSSTQPSAPSFNDRSSEVINVHDTTEILDNSNYRDNPYFEDEALLLDDVCGLVPTSQPNCSIQSVGLHDSFLLSPLISEPKILTQSPNTAQTCDDSSPTQGLDGNQAKCWSESGSFSSIEGSEQTLNQTPVLNTHFPIQAAPMSIETPKETDHKNCTCLKSIIFLINELESWTDSSKTLDALDLCSSLAEHKRAVRKGEVLFQCEKCSTLSKNMIMLGLLVDRLLVFCEKIILSYIIAANSQLSPGQKDLFFGEFEVDTDMQWALLFGGLIALQIKSLTLLIEGISSRAEGSLGSKLETSKLKIQHLRQLLDLRLPSGVIDG